MLRANIVYATMTGNNEEIADIVCDSLRNQKVEVRENEISEIDIDDFKKADILVVCAYTYDEGALPEESLDLYEDLPETDLRGKVYGVAGSGDKYYGKYFNTTVDHFDEAFQKAGATSGADKVKIDLEPDEEDIETLDRFAHDLVKTAKQQ